MSTTLTIRASEALREALSRRAASQDKTVFEVVLEILEETLRRGQPLAARAGHLKGRRSLWISAASVALAALVGVPLLELPSESDDPWHERLRERNWRS